MTSRAPRIPNERSVVRRQGSSRSVQTQPPRIRSQRDSLRRGGSPGSVGKPPKRVTRAGPRLADQHEPGAPRASSRRFNVSPAIVECQRGGQHSCLRRCGGRAGIATSLRFFVDSLSTTLKRDTQIGRDFGAPPTTAAASSASISAAARRLGRRERGPARLAATARADELPPAAAGPRRMWLWAGSGTSRRAGKGAARRRGPYH